ncbi:hypothetical protein [Alteribacillus iranensis]|uniref:Uncharacterized protein n=1 Tax=Alteribacillus iranensis TaxID=930128 RepID=A0A1I2FAD1_9BACI|nr:hypothetical protein [Alteribacillus iranensis]SFF01879.1 hypothetical protein SAMN05192532_11013 [Alteribacillus iranensis]
MHKQKYYVNLHPLSMDDISPVKIPDSSLIQYEIEVTPTELEEMEYILEETQAHDLELHNLFTFEHYNQDATDVDSKEVQYGMNRIFEKIYEYGTPETKGQLDEMGVMDLSPNRSPKH